MKKASIVQRLSGNNDAGMEKAASQSLIQPSLPASDPLNLAHVYMKKKMPTFEADFTGLLLSKV